MKTRKKSSEIFEFFNLPEKCEKTNKIAFRSKAAAFKHIIKMKSSNVSIAKLNAYECQFCNKWHMTSHRKSFIPGIHT